MAPLTDVDAAARAIVGAPYFAAPAAVLAASIATREGRRRCAGRAGALSHEASADAVTDTTIFDLASVTKPLVALTFARLERRGVLHRSEPLGDVLPEARGTSSAETPLDLLLAHRSGLEAHIQIYAPLVDAFDRTGSIARGGEIPIERAIEIAANARRKDAVGATPEEGFPPVYSDMGYLLVGAAMRARASREAPIELDALVQREVLEPLDIAGRDSASIIGSARQLRARGEGDRLGPFDRRVAPTEDIAFRGGVIRGAVHDENAFVVSGDGMSGHAGLFGTAAAVLRVGEAILAVLDDPNAAWLSREDLAPLVRTRPGGSLLAGFDRRSAPAKGDPPSSGARLSASTFGHLGFTGTSLWIDPAQRFAGVLLTNRVHPTREHTAIRRARPFAYDSMFDALVS